MPDHELRKRYTIDYQDDETEKIDEPNQRGWRTSARVRKRCDVEVVIDLDEVARVMGARACRSKGGKCRDGYLTVRKVGQPIILERKELPRDENEDAN